MTEPNEISSSATTQKSVVDDFFSALFANNNSSNNNNHDTPTTPAEKAVVVKEEAKPTTNDHIIITSARPGFKPSNYRDVDSAQVDDDGDIKPEIKKNLKRERVLDEFDEYSLLSKRRGSKENNISTTKDLDEKLERQILSKRDIDWSNVKPESRMLVRQLPKTINKQDVLSHFSKYGEVLEVVQKTPFGFVHFENPEACAQAVQAENGQPFHGIILDLEICKRKPFFARAQEKERREAENRKRLEQSPQQDINRRLSRADQRNNGRYQQPSSHSPPSPSRRRPEPIIKNNDYRPDYGRQRQQDGYRPALAADTYRQPQHQHQINDSRYNNNNNMNNIKSYNGGRAPYRDDPRTRHNDDSRNNYNNDYSSSRYIKSEPNHRYSRYDDGSNNNNNNYNQRPPTNSSSSFPSGIPPRHGSDVPMVQIVSWDSVAYGYTDYIERVLSTNGIRASSLTLPFSNNTREAIVKQMILEGVKAIVMIDRHNEAQNKVYLQVFAPTEYGQSVRFDEYDSVTALEVISIIHRMHPPASTTAYAPVSTAPATMTNQQAPIDMNTLASLYNLIQQPAAQPVTTNTVSPPVNSSQPTIPQLLATLVNGLGVQQASSPVQAPPPPPPPVQQNNNIAALISTAASGNPALAQLLAQMTTDAQK